MTYGENAGQLRTQLTVLLHQHRIQQRLGGRGAKFPATTTPNQRHAIGDQIRRYRHAILTWCLQALQVTNPHTLGSHSMRPRDRHEELLHRLKNALAAHTAGLPTMTELTTAQHFSMVEAWRQAARASALGEHDLTAVHLGPLTRAQGAIVVADAAAITEAVAVLDLRYRNIPGWEHLHGRGALARVARDCGELAARTGLDYTVDAHGWRASAAPIDGPGRPGIAGVVQAEHNLLVGLTRFPDALSLRRILDSQRVLSHTAAQLADPAEADLAHGWLRRTETYSALVRHTRDLGSLVGDGGCAASESANAACRARRLSLGSPVPARAMHHLDALFTRVDGRLADLLDHGVARRLYLMREVIPQLAEVTDDAVVPARAQFVPITSSLHRDVLSTIRERLRPPADAAPAPRDALTSRDQLRAALQGP